ncbi:NAD-dependent epimerase/dehydratase family protein [Chryseolinea sp. H1M3-3]|uniref:NAD-dependent epimerase/dehydratase family protein n=1 Tax=Chryseolinea sp. H1M3-3 TaxID=3034144 RepID=UPI0023EDD041|nr:NAD-dependent epimerase/dehydratase family protein [Chryseolinea sp. H1M3-3]
MDINSLYQKLLEPSNDLLSDMARLDGDITILGVGGKMGPDLARLTRHAIDMAGIKKEVIGVARFSEPGLQQELEQHGIRTYKADLLRDQQLQELPVTRNVLYLAGMKFGTTGKESLTWAMNSYLPGRVAEKFKDSRIVVFSTGNVYPLMPVQSDGATEQEPTGPIGEYAQSCLGRERVFQYFSSLNNTPTLIYRLNYANDVTYGVLLDIAKAVYEKRPIDLRMGYVNVIWQGEANEMALRALHHCAVPAKILNITGPDTLSVRRIAEQFAQLFKTKPVFVNEEQNTALLSNASESYRLFGKQKVSLDQMMEVIASWIVMGGKTLNKPTHFQEREGKF